MTGQQRAVLWIGLILVGLNLVTRWSQIRDVIFSGSGITAGIPGSGGGSDSGGLGGIIGGAIGGAFRGIMPGGGGFISSSTPQHNTKDVMMV
jgi:hypothetical protein